MKLFIVERIDAAGYDETDGVLVRACDGKGARKIVVENLSKHGNREGKDFADPKQVRVRRIEEPGASGILMRDFRAG